jgi:hypothetical protein
MSIDGDGDGDCDSPVDLEKGATEVKAAAMKGAKKEVNPRLAMCVKVALVRLNSSLNYRVSNFSHAVVHICGYTYIFFCLPRMQLLISCCLRLSRSSAMQNVNSVVHYMFVIGFVTWMVVNSNNWWDPWPALLLLPMVVLTVKLTPKLDFANNTTPASDADDDLTAKLLTTPT